MLWILCGTTKLYEYIYIIPASGIYSSIHLLVNVAIYLVLEFNKMYIRWLQSERSWN